jgi:hypothetical protein
MSAMTTAFLESRHPARLFHGITTAPSFARQFAILPRAFLRRPIAGVVRYRGSSLTQRNCEFPPRTSSILGKIAVQHSWAALQF